MGAINKKIFTEKIEAILFDFDFTLADSSKGVVECVSYGFKLLNLPNPSKHAIFKTIGLSLKDTFRKLAGTMHENKADIFSQFFIQKADEVMADLTVMYDDVYYVIPLLKSHGIILGIVSTKFRYRIESILARENLIEYFDVIVGGEDVINHKPNPESILLAISKLNISPLHTIYIGDSATDAETAKRAGVYFLPVLSGTTLQESFNNYEILGMLNKISELPKMLGI